MKRTGSGARTVVILHESQDKDIVSKHVLDGAQVCIRSGWSRLVCPAVVLRILSMIRVQATRAARCTDDMVSRLGDTSVSRTPLIVHAL